MGFKFRIFNYKDLLLNFLFSFLLLTFFLQTRYAFFRRHEVIDYLIPFVYLSDVLIILLLACTLVSQKDKLFKFLRSLKSLRTGKWNFLFFCFSVFLFSTAISNFSAISPVAAWYRWFKLLEFGLFAFWIGWFIKEKSIINHQSSIINFLSLGLAFQCFIAIVEFVLQHSLNLQILGEWRFSFLTPGIAKVILNGKELLRPYATFPHPNVLGGILAIMAPVSLHLALGKRGEKGEKGNKGENRFPPTTFHLPPTTYFLLFTVTLFLTFSRSAWLAYGVLIAAVLVFWVRRGIGGIGVMLGKRKPLLCLLFAVCCLLFAVPFIYQRVKSLQTTDVLSVERRVELSRAAISMFWEHPLFGVGLGNFVPNLEKYLIVSGQGRFLQPVHNVPLLILAETGVVGFLAISLFLTVLLYNFVRSGSINLQAPNSKSQAPNLPVQAGKHQIQNHKSQTVLSASWRIGIWNFVIFLMWFGILITSLFDHYWWTLQAGNLFFWLTVGLTLFL